MKMRKGTNLQMRNTRFMSPQCPVLHTKSKQKPNTHNTRPVSQPYNRKHIYSFDARDAFSWHTPVAVLQADNRCDYQRLYEYGVVHGHGTEYEREDSELI